MNLFSAMEIAASGLSAQRARMNAVASNLANARTTQTEQEGPYRRLDPVFRAVPVTERVPELSGKRSPAYMVEVPEVRQDEAPPRQVYDPGHPDADEAGFVNLPNVNVVEEMVNMITASRAYEANITAMQSVRTMARSAIDLGA